LKKNPSKLAFKRVRKARGIFRYYTEEKSPEKKKPENEFQDVLQFTPQTAQFGNLYCLHMDEQFIFKQTCIAELPS